MIYFLRIEDQRTLHQPRKGKWRLNRRERSAGRRQAIKR